MGGGGGDFVGKGEGRGAGLGQLGEAQRDGQEEVCRVDAADEGVCGARGLDVGEDGGHGELGARGERLCGGGDGGGAEDARGEDRGRGGAVCRGGARVCAAVLGDVNLLVDELRGVGAGVVGALEDVAQAQLVGQAVLPAGLGPPAQDLFADVLEALVLADHLGDPVGEEVDVGVAVGGQHADAGVLADERVADGEGLVCFCDVVEGVGGDRVDEVGHVAADRVDGGGDDGGGHGGGGDEVGLVALFAALALCLVPDAEAAPPADALAASAKGRLAANLLGAGDCAREAGLLDHPGVGQGGAVELADEVAGQDDEVALDGGLDLGQAEEVAGARLVGEGGGGEQLGAGRGQRGEVGVLRHGGLDGVERLGRGDEGDVWRSSLSRAGVCAGAGLRTRDAHAIAPFERVPDHGPVGNGQQGLGHVAGRRGEGAKGRAGPAENERLEARRGQRGVGHGRLVVAVLLAVLLAVLVAVWAWSSTQALRSPVYVKCQSHPARDQTRSRIWLPASHGRPCSPPVPRLAHVMSTPTPAVLAAHQHSHIPRG